MAFTRAGPLKGKTTLAIYGLSPPSTVGLPQSATVGVDPSADKVRVPSQRTSGLLFRACLRLAVRACHDLLCSETSHLVPGNTATCHDMRPTQKVCQCALSLFLACALWFALLRATLSSLHCSAASIADTVEHSLSLCRWLRGRTRRRDRTPCCCTCSSVARRWPAPNRLTALRGRR